MNDERTAELLEKSCKKSHIPVDMKGVTRADGSITHTAFCEVKSIDQVAALLKMASEQVLEEQKEMTKTLVLYDDKSKEVMSADFVNNGEINMDDVETLSRFSTRFEIKDRKFRRSWSKRKRPLLISDGLSSSSRSIMPMVMLRRIFNLQRDYLRVAQLLKAKNRQYDK